MGLEREKDRKFKKNLTLFYLKLEKAVKVKI